MGSACVTFIDNHLVNPTDPLYITLYGCMIVVFAYFYTAIAFDPTSRPTTSASRAATSPASGPGRPPSAICRASSTGSHCPARCSWPSSPSLPSLALALVGTSPNYPFAGTTLLIAVGVALETMKQIDSQLMMRNYEGFLK